MRVFTTVGSLWTKATALMSNKEQTEEEYLAGYDADRYPKPSVTVDAVLLAEDKVLLVKRGNHPQKGRWALPGGFLEMTEDLPEAARRELKEETAVEVQYLEQIGVYGTPGRDPRDRVISVAYAARLDEEIRPQAGDDAAQSGWFQLSLRLQGDDGELLLSNAGEKLRVRFLLQNAPFSRKRQVREILLSDLAFDHGQILVDGLLCLGKGVEKICTEII